MPEKMTTVKEELKSSLYNKKITVICIELFIESVNGLDWKGP